VVSLVEFASLTPGPGQVAVEMEAATINASDFLYITGQYFLTPSTHSDVGAEGVGRITAVGPEVDGALLGARVVLLPSYRHGTWATHLVASVSDVVLAPEGADVLQLAMVGINPMTALRLLRDYGNPDAEDRWIGQTAGNSAVGEYLVKLAKRFGHRTLSVVRREAAAEQVRSWGGDLVVVDGDDLGVKLADALGEKTLDLAVDSIGGPASTELAHRLRFGASLVTYAYLSGRPSEVGLLDLIGNHVNLTGFWLHNWMKRADAAHVQADYREVIDLVADGTLSARVEATATLDDFKAAFAAATRQGREGKILFTFE
jgi:trans-2-enoyl-CoA reductase